jgi:AcrR family transcriptional regulator
MSVSSSKTPGNGSEASPGAGRKRKTGPDVLRQDDISLLRGIDLRPNALPSVSERVGIATMAVVLENGLQNLRGVPLSAIADLANTTQSSLYRKFPKGTNQIIDTAIEWSFATTNSAIMRWAYDFPAGVTPPSGLDWDRSSSDLTGFTHSMPAVEGIQNDFRAVLTGMWDDPAGRLAATGTLLSLRRGELMRTEQSTEAARFKARLQGLSAAHLGVERESIRAESLATWLANYLASAWFSWLNDEAYLESDDYMFGIDYIMAGLDLQLRTAFEAVEASRSPQPRLGGDFSGRSPDQASS